MSMRRLPVKKSREISSPKKSDQYPEVALAAIASYRKQKEVSDFINFILEALERNCNWLNNMVGKQPNFKCVLMAGAGPNRFQVQEVIYPSNDQDMRLEVELNDSEDHDKIAIAAVLKISSLELENMLKYLKTRMYENPILKEDLVKGRALGINFAVLRPFAENQYRIMERISFGNAVKCEEHCKKRLREDKSLAETILRKTKRIA